MPGDKELEMNCGDDVLLKGPERPCVMSRSGGVNGHHMIPPCVAHAVRGSSQVMSMLL